MYNEYPFIRSPISGNETSGRCVPRLPAGLQATFTFSSNPAGSFPAFWTLLRGFASLGPVQSSKKPRVVQAAGADEGVLAELAAIGDDADIATARVQLTGQRRAIPMSSEAGLCGRVLLLVLLLLLTVRCSWFIVQQRCCCWVATWFARWWWCCCCCWRTAQSVAGGNAPGDCRDCWVARRLLAHVSRSWLFCNA